MATPSELDVLRDQQWQMLFGERFALEGVLTQLRPGLSIETGTAQGGSLRRIAAHSDEVHAFDIVEEVAELEKSLSNVTVHIGDSAVVLPEVLDGFVREGRHVDFALIDGDHSYEGVRRDTLAVVESEACRHTVILFHDTANDTVRAGLESLRLAEHPKAAVVMLDFVPGYLVAKGTVGYSLAAWNGLGLVILDADRPADAGPAVTLGDRINITEIYQRVRPIYDGKAVPVMVSDEALPYDVPDPVPGAPTVRPLPDAPPAPAPTASPRRRPAALAAGLGTLGGLALGAALRRRR